MPDFIAALLERFGTAAGPRFADTVLAAPDEEPPHGCGWFDSSHELRAGLDVVEHASADAVASQMPLADWLSMHLAGWQPAEPAAT